MLQPLTFASIFCICISLAADDTISTAAGTGTPEPNGAIGPAATFQLGDPFGVEIGPGGDLFITEVRNHRVLRLNLDTRQIETVAGTGKKGFGRQLRAKQCDLNEPYEVRFDDQGNMYFVEMQNHLVRRVDASSGEISIVAGTGQQGFGGDGGPATNAMFNRPHSIALDNHGNLYVADIGNHRIRRIDLETGIVTTFLGNGKRELPKEGRCLPADPILGPRALFIQGQTLWIALREGHSIWKMDLSDRNLTRVAGTGKKGFSGDGGDPLQATFNGPKGIAVSAEGQVFVVDTENQAIRMIDQSANTIRTIAGRGPKFRGGDGDEGPATSAELARPHGICVDGAGNIYIGDTLNHRVRFVLRGHSQ